MLNMFRMLLHPSSGACDLFVELFHGLYYSVRIAVFALAYLFSGECLVVTCVVVLESVFLQILAAAVSYSYWVFFVCSMFFDNVSWIYSDVMYTSFNTPGTMCVGVTLWFSWGGVVSRWRLKHYWSKTTTHVTTKHSPLNKYANAKTAILTEQYNPWNNSKNKSQAPEDGCTNIRNMLSIK